VVLEVERASVAASFVGGDRHRVGIPRQGDGEGVETSNDKELVTA
jgi:hypothetical protein